MEREPQATDSGFAESKDGTRIHWSVVGSGAPGIRVCIGAEGLAVGGEGRQIGGAPTGLDCGDGTRGPTLGGTLGNGGTGGSREGVTGLCGGGGGGGAARGGALDMSGGTAQVSHGGRSR